jgi:membrane-associated phospholipid phosphatase
VTEALIRSRDGIVGPWADPTASPTELPQNNTANLALWAPWVRATLFDFEMYSRIGFTEEGASDTTKKMQVWHLELSPPSGGTMEPSTDYQPLVSMIRPDKTRFADQLVYLSQYAQLRNDRAAEILAQLTPPIAFLGAIGFLHPDRTPKTLELLAAVLRLANFVEMRLKSALACRRPNEFSPQVQPMILTPAHGTLPSGHSTESFAAAFVLWKLLRATGKAPYGTDIWGSQFMNLAARIAINRTVAGVHFPVDSVAGAILGLTLGSYFVERCSQAEGATASYDAWAFDGEQYPLRSSGANADFDWHDFYDVVDEKQTGPAGYVTEIPDQALGADGQSKILHWLWDQAIKEWH